MTARANSPASGQVRLISTSFLALFAIVGLVLYGLPLYYDFFVKELGWTRAEVTSGNMIGKVLVGPLFGFLAGALIDRVGPRKPMMVGIVVASLALVGLGNVQTIALFYVFYAMNALGYVLAGPLPNQVLLSRNFKESRGRAMGIAYVGIGIGFFFVPQITKYLIGAFGWRTALMLLGGLVVVVAMPLVLFLREGEGPAAAAARAEAPKAPLREHLANRNFYILALGSMASIGAVGGAIQHFKMMLTLDKGWSQAEAFDIISMIAVVSLIGRFGAGWLADKIGPKRVMLIVYALVTVAMLILVSGAEGGSIYLYVLCFGLGLGGEYLIIPLMAAQLYGTAVLGRVMGIILTADGVAEALFPWIVGKLHDSTGSYSAGFQLLAALAAFGAVAVAMLPAKRPAEASAVTT
jgi:nitrate/nitrite transporter NarK